MVVRPLVGTRVGAAWCDAALRIWGARAGAGAAWVGEGQGDAETSKRNSRGAATLLAGWSGLVGGVGRGDSRRAR